MTDDPTEDARRRREPLWLAATGLVAVAVPLAAAAHLQGRVERLGPALSDLTGLRSSVGGVEAGLSGTVRITDVRVGELFAADAVEASVALERLLAGELGADEVRVERPRLRAQLSADGDSDLARVLRRVAARRPAGGAARGGGGGRLRRIVVTEGALVVEVIGVGTVSARGVELHPQAGGVRLVTTGVAANLRRGPVELTATLARSGGDLALPDARLTRWLGVGGDLAVTAGGAPLAVRGAAIGLGVAEPGVLTVRGDADDAGVPRPLVLTARRDGGGTLVEARGDGVPLGWLAPAAPGGVALAHARASGGLRLDVDRAGGWTAHVDAALAGAQIEHRAIADRPFAVEGALALDLAAAGGVVRVDAARLTRGALVVDAHGFVRRGGPAGVSAGELDVAVAAAPCLGLLASVPPELLGPLDAFALDGELGAQLGLTFDLAAPPGEGVELAIDVANGCRVLDEPPGADVRRLAGVVEHDLPGGGRVPVGPGVGDWIALVSLPGHVDGAFVSAEDARFWDHDGFDREQIARSLEIDLREGRFARGGSTISQQLVKNALLSHRRTLDRKLQEAVLTWRLEDVLSKRQILERYLNIVELGPGVHGVAAAARHWFGKPAAELSVLEAAFLAALTPEPRTMARRIAGHGGLDPDSAARVDTVLRHMQRAGVITTGQRDAARGQRLALRAEVLAPRLSQR